MILAQNGLSKYKVIIPTEASPAVRFAAVEFVDIFRQITGIALPVRTDSQSEYNCEIVIGRTSRACKAGEIDFEALGEEGYAIKTREDRLAGTLYIAAGGDRGTLYGVYSFFEDYLGCRWFTEKLTRIPKRSTVQIGAIDKTFVPTFSFRKAAFRDSNEWQFSLRNKLNSKLGTDSVAEHGREVTYAVGFAHTMNTLVPDELFDEHPEYFPMNEKGERFHGIYTQRCLTNPDVLAMSIEKVKAAFRADPDAMIASVTQADTAPDIPDNCRCPKCRAIDEEEGSLTGSFLRYVNAIAEAVEEEFPGRYIDTFAYRYTRTPPKITKPRKNVIIRLCSVEGCFSHPISSCDSDYQAWGIGHVHSAGFAKDIRGWAAIAPNLHIWDYNTNFRFYPAPLANLHVFADNMKFFRENNVIGVYPEGAHDSRGSDMAELKAYILAKLQWDPDYDADKGIEEFVQAYCGAGAPYIMDYIRELSEMPERENLHQCCYEIPRREFFTPKFMAYAEDCFDKAEMAAENDEVLERIRFWRMSLRYIRLWLYADTFTETALWAEFGSFFADMEKFGMTSIFEGGDLDRSMEQMKKQIEEQLA